MYKNKSNLKIYCISHEYIKELDKLNLNIIGSGAYKQKFPKNWLNDSKGKKNISKKKFKLWYLNIHILDLEESY